MAVIACTAAILLCHDTHTGDDEVFTDKFASGVFSLEGNSVFFGEEKVSSCHVAERHDGENYRIERLDKTYVKKDNQYYIDEGGGLTAVSVPADELAGIEEMFNRKSELSNYSFSDLEAVSQYPAEIPSPEGEPVACICQEYHLKGDLEEDSPALKFYFLDDALYAIQSKDDSRFIFYVEAWS